MSGRWNRRQLLGATFGLAATGSLGALVPGAARGAAPDVTGAPGATGVQAATAAAAVPAGGATTLVVVHDSRHAASLRHAAALAPRAARLLDAREDLARQWYGELRARAERAPLALAGMTSWSDFLVLRGCAAECGLRAATHELVRNVDGSGRTLVRWQIGRQLA